MHKTRKSHKQPTPPPPKKKKKKTDEKKGVAKNENKVLGFVKK
jgi:hypothetical protein